MALGSSLPVATTAADANTVFGLQGGTTKQFPMSVIRSGQKIVTGPSSTTENKIPQWDSTTLLLKDGLTLATEIAATATASDSKVPTEQAVRELAETMQRWVEIPTTSFETNLSTDHLDTSDDSIDATADWTAVTGYTVGDWVKPTVYNGLVYQAASTGTTDASEPTWITIPGELTSDSGVTWIGRSCHVIETTASLRSLVSPGTPIRLSSTAFNYGIVVATTDEKIAFYGNTETYAVDRLYYAEKELVSTERFTIPGEYATATGDILGSVGKQCYVWRGPDAAIVDISAKHITDADAQQPYINVKVNGTAVCFDREEYGLLVNETTWTRAAPGTMKDVYSVLSDGDEIEIECTQVSADTHASDLSVVLTLVAA